MAASSRASACLRATCSSRHARFQNAQASPGRTALISRTLDLGQSRRLQQRSRQRRAAIVQASTSLQPSSQGSFPAKDPSRVRACSGSQEAVQSGASSCGADLADGLAAEGSPQASGSATAGVEAEQRTGGGSVLGAIALITGTSVGAGMLALPSETVPAGFLPSATLLTVCWAFLTLEAFLIADVNIGLMKKKRQETSAGPTNGSGDASHETASNVISLRTMAEETLGPVGGWVSTATYVFLSYTLVVAYVAKAADVVTLGTDISFELASGVFVAALGGLVYAGNTQTTDWANRIMTGALLVLFGLIVSGGLFEADWSQLAVQDWAQAPDAVPVLFLSLVFHDLIPVLCTYLDGDLKKVRTSIAVGGAVPLAMFLIWDAVALGLPQGAGMADPLEALMSLGGPAQFAVIEGFSLLAVMTSFIGTALSMSEFFMEQLGNVFQPSKPAASAAVVRQGQLSEHGTAKESSFSRQQLLRAAAFGLVLLPSWALSCNIPHAFFTASEAAGAYGMTVLYGIFPPLMFWRARQQAKAAEGRPEAVEKQSLWDKPAGGFALASMAACSFSVLVSQAMIDTSGFTWGKGIAASSTSPSSSLLVLASTTPVSDGVRFNKGPDATVESKFGAQPSLCAPMLAVEEEAQSA